MPNYVFYDAPAATGGFEFWTTTGGSPTTDTVDYKDAPRSIKCAAVGDYCRKDCLADAGRRLTFWVKPKTIPTNFGAGVLTAKDVFDTTVFALDIDTSGRLTLSRALSGGSSVSSSANDLFAADTWARVSVGYTITNTTTHTIRVWVNGTLAFDKSDGTLAGTGTARLRVGWVYNAANVTQINLQHVVVDDGTTLDDPGDRRVTAKRAAAANTNSFDTLIGSATNRWDYVSEVPLSEAKGIEHAAATDVQENFTLESASAGDVNISGGTVVSCTGWVWAKRGTAAAPAPTIQTNQAKTTGVGLTHTAVTVAAGDLAVVVFADQVGGAAPTISDDRGNAWTALTGGTNTVRLSAWYSRITNAGSMQAAVAHASSANARALVIGVWKGTPTSPLDKNPAALTDSTSPYTSPSSGTLAQAEELAIGYWGLAGPSGDTTAVSSPGGLAAKTGTTGGSAGTNCIAILGYDSVNATTALTRDATDSTGNRAGVAGVATFKLAPVAKLMLNGTETDVTLATTSALYASRVDGGSYPSNAAGIGMRSAVSAPTYFYEGGVVIAYAPALPPPVTPPGLVLSQAANRAANY